MPEPQQINLDMNTLLIRQALANAVVLPLILSPITSINLSAVASYGNAEKLDDKDKPTGEFVPVVTFIGGNEIELSEEENKLFRDVWKNYADNSNVLFSMLTYLDQQTVQVARQSII